MLDKIIDSLNYIKSEYPNIQLFVYGRYDTLYVYTPNCGPAYDVTYAGFYDRGIVWSPEYKCWCISLNSVHQTIPLTEANQPSSALNSLEF